MNFKKIILNFFVLSVALARNIGHCKGNNSYEQLITTSNFSIKSEMCKWSISKNNQCVHIAITILEDKLFSYYGILLLK